MSTKSPFALIVKRVRKLLAILDKRALGDVDLFAKSKDAAKLAQIASARSGQEEVVLKATARAIERALGVALFFQGQPDYRVRFRTGTVGVVDDIVETSDRRGVAGEEAERAGVITDETKDGVVLDTAVDDLPDTQIRRMSTIEVAISLR